MPGTTAMMIHEPVITFATIMPQPYLSVGLMEGLGVRERSGAGKSRVEESRAFPFPSRPVVSSKYYRHFQTPAPRVVLAGFDYCCSKSSFINRAEPVRGVRD